MSPLDRDLVTDVANELGVVEAFVEKDWRVVEALQAIQDQMVDGFEPIFSGGTSLSKGWDCIKRISEDIDSKMQVSAKSLG